MTVTAFLEAVTRWARSRPDIEAVALVGSHARGAAAGRSDVDLVILTPGADGYLRDRSWVSLFGDAAECRQEDHGRVTSVRAFYESGLEVEYGALKWALAARFPRDRPAYTEAKSGFIARVLGESEPPAG